MSEIRKMTTAIASHRSFGSRKSAIMKNVGPVVDSCDTLKAKLVEIEGKTERRNVIKAHIQQLLEDPRNIGDFEPGLEWFNAGEPLSLGRQLRGKVVVLDFFTYCCINCMHILPHLRELENTYTTSHGLVVVGVHSAKFDNEKDSSNIAAAMQRYSVQHPVVNDKNGTLWSKLNIPCWPTLLILGPHGDPLFQLIGEGHEKELFEYVGTSLEYFGDKGSLSTHNLLPGKGQKLHGDLLLFPGKIASILEGDGTEIIAISNTGLHTLVVATQEGTVRHIVGGVGEPDFRDGDFSTARFNSPQGLAFYNSHTLFVADTENHAIRKIDLKLRNVSTVAGTGSMGSDLRGGLEGSIQQLSSPWDVCFVRLKGTRVPDFPSPYFCICPPAPSGYTGRDEVSPPLSPASSSLVPPANAVPLPPPPPPVPIPPMAPVGILPPPPLPISTANATPLPPSPVPVPPMVPVGVPLPPAPPVSAKVADCIPPPTPLEQPSLDNNNSWEEEQTILIIAMAGCHQIWGYFLQNTIWWRGDYFAANTCGALAGTGREENRNNTYPKSAGFAQPSGVAFAPERKELLVADSESSSVRCVQMPGGKVSAVVGASRDPDDLFCFGDVDGVGYDARLQHPLGVACSGNILFLADSYNHKIKTIDLRSRQCSTFIGNGKPGNSVIGNESQLNEPGGVCVSADGSHLYIADTNNHCIKVVDIKRQIVRKLDLVVPSVNHNEAEQYITTTHPSILRVALGGKLNLRITVSVPNGVGINSDAPQRWHVLLPNVCWRAAPENGIYKHDFGLDVIFVAPTLSSLENVVGDLIVKMKLFLCVNGSCQMRLIALKIPVVCDATAHKEVFHDAILKVTL